MSDSAADNVRKINVVKLDSVEWDFELEVGTNKVTAKGAYRDSYPGWMARCPAGGSAHPDISALLLKKISAKRVEGDLIDVTLSFECNDPEATYPGREPGKVKRYTIEPTTGEEPLLTFHKLTDLDDQSQEALGELLASSRTKEDFAKAVAAIGADPLALFALAKIRKGVEAYRSAGIIWVERFSTKNLADMNCAKFYKIDNDVPGDPPPLADGANWLYIPGSADPHEDGKTWDMERKWEASLEGGWDAWFYGEDETPEE